MQIETNGIDLSNYTYKRVGRPAKSIPNKLAVEAYNHGYKVGEFFFFQKVEGFDTDLFRSAIRTLNSRNGTNVRFCFFNDDEDETRYKIIRVN